MTLLPNATTGLAEVEHPDYPNLRIPAVVLIPGQSGLSVGLNAAQAQTLSEQLAKQTELLQQAGNLVTLLTTVQQLVTALRSQGTDPIVQNTADTASQITGLLGKLEEVRAIAETIQGSQGDTSGIETDASTIASKSSSIDGKLSTVLSRLSDIENQVIGISSKLTSISTTLSALSSISTDIKRKLFFSQYFEGISVTNPATTYTYSVPFGTKKITIAQRRSAGYTTGQIRYGWSSYAVSSGDCGYIDSDFEETIEMYFTATRTLYLRGSEAGMRIIIKRWS